MTLTLALAVLVAGGCRVMPGASPATPSSPPAQLSPTASPPATADAADAFFDRFAQDPPPYRLLLEVEIRGISSGSALIDADVDGEYYRADVRVELADLPPRQTEIVYVDGTGYLREADATSWVVVPDYRSTPPLNPFLTHDRADFSERDDDPADTLRHLSSSEWVEEDETLGYREGGVREVQFDVWIDEQGVPVRATLDFELAGVDPIGQPIDLSYSARYTFSDVGSDITITPPVPAGDEQP